MFNLKIPEPSGRSAHANGGPTLREPKIGIALGAGAARGWSHIGVLQELAAHGIFPEIVAGTSIGALVGGFYAADQLETLEDFACTLTKKRVLGLLDLSLSGIGLLGGAKLKKSLEDAIGDITIESLPRHFAIVATEVGTGHEVWLRRGSLVEAIRASYAVPGIFEPVRIDDRLLFDGALVNPVPVTICRVLGADLVIAVNIIGDNAFRGTVLSDTLARDLNLANGNSANHAAAAPRSQSAPGLAGIVMDAFNITQDRISRSRLAGDPPDVMINARNSHIGFFDFHRADELIAIGRDAARRALTDITEQMARMPQAATEMPQPAARV